MASAEDGFIVSHILNSGKSILDTFAQTSPDLSPEEREIVRGWHDTHTAFFQILAALPDG